MYDNVHFLSHLVGHLFFFSFSAPTKQSGLYTWEWSCDFPLNITPNIVEIPTDVSYFMRLFITAGKTLLWNQGRVSSIWQYLVSGVTCKVWKLRELFLELKTSLQKCFRETPWVNLQQHISWARWCFIPGSCYFTIATSCSYYQGIPCLPWVSWPGWPSDTVKGFWDATLIEFWASE